MNICSNIVLKQITFKTVGKQTLTATKTIESKHKIINNVQLLPISFINQEIATINN